MVLFLVKWDIHPDKLDTYLQWTGSAIKRTVAVPGVVEFRAFRPATGTSQVALTYEFADLAAWAAWNSHDDVQAVLAELHTLALNVSLELWGQSSVVPEPIRPGR